MKTINIGLVILLMIVVGFGTHFWTDSKASKQELDLIENQSREKITQLETKITGLESNISLLDDKIEKANEELEEEKEEAKKALEEKDNYIKKLESVPPESLVIETRRILNTDEIWIAGKRVEFSLNAFRDTTIKLFDWEDCTLVREPRYKRQIITLEGSIESLNSKDEKNQEIIRALKEKNSTIENINQAWKDYISKQTVKSKIESLLWNIGSFSLGYLVGSKK